MRKLGITLPNLYRDTRKRVIINMSVFVGMFFFSWAPFYIVRLATLRLQRVAHVDIATELAAFHAVANPLAYLYLDKNCWRAFTTYINQYNEEEDQQGRRFTDKSQFMASEDVSEDTMSTVTTNTIHEKERRRSKQIALCGKQDLRTCQ